MKTFDRALLVLVHSCMILSEHMTHCDDTKDCSAREFLRATVSKSFMQWLTLHGITEQTIRGAENNEAQSQIIEDFLEAINTLIEGNKDLDVLISEIRTKTMTAANQIKATAATLRN